MGEPFPDPGSLSDEGLKRQIKQLAEEEQEISERRRVVHRTLDSFRNELVNRLRKGKSFVKGSRLELFGGITSIG